MENSKKKKKGLARCLELASDRKGLVILSAVFSSLAATASFIPYYAIYCVISGICANYPDLDVGTLKMFGILAVLGIIGNILLYFLAILCSHLAAFGTLYDLRINFARHITSIPLGYHMTIGSGKLRKIMEDNIESIEGFIAHQFPDFVASVVSPIVMAVILFIVDWRFGLASFAGVILAFVAEFIGFGSGKMKENMNKYQSALEDMNNASVEYVRGMAVLKAFNQSATSFVKLKSAIASYTEWVLKFSLGWQNCMPAFTTIINNIYLVIVPVGILTGVNSSDYKSHAVKFIFYLTFAPAIAGILNKIMYISESFTQIDGNVERMDEILSIGKIPEVQVSDHSEGNEVVFDHVVFSYDKKKVLDDVSFSCKPGRLTALVGPSGGGKSTCANLISRFWDVDEGSIRIGGADIRKLTNKDLTDKVSFVYQEVFLFKQSIEDNIKMGRPDASREEVISAAKAAQCHEFIMGLKDGYDTVLGQDGVYLSGGEKQRISIARAILKDSPVIVLDEATAFSDPENEYLIRKALDSLTEGKTVIMIAHRLSTVIDADKIIVMDGGKKVEEGTHDELLKAGGRYKTMWDSYNEACNWKI